MRKLSLMVKKLDNTLMSIEKFMLMIITGIIESISDSIDSLMFGIRIKFTQFCYSSLDRFFRRKLTVNLFLISVFYSAIYSIIWIVEKI